MTDERADYIISIHALRVEGDVSAASCVMVCLLISIHALRVEGDPIQLILTTPSSFRFLSTPSGWRATTEAPSYH